MTCLAEKNQRVEAVLEGRVIYNIEDECLPYLKQGDANFGKTNFLQK